MQLGNRSLAMILLLFSPMGVLASSKTDRERGDLKGPVKSVRTESAMYSGPGGNCSQDKITLQSVSQYNADGNLARYTDYNFDGATHRDDVFRYDSSGALAGLTSYDNSGFAFWKHVFDGQNGGRPTSETMYKQDGSADWVITWQYNDKGQPLGTSTHDSQGVLMATQRLDPNGKVIEDSLYKDGSLESKRINTYDSNGILLESVHYKADGSLVDGPKDPARSVYAYDSAGHLTEQIAYDASGSLASKLSYTYDAHGNITEGSYYRDGVKLLSRRIYTYEYDTAGNWTRQTISEDFGTTCSHPMQVIYRTITYY